MANYYLDPINGNDSTGDGSLGNPWKTWTSGATAARIAPGDEIRIKKNADPVSLGVTGTLTQNGSAITLSSAVTALISNCESAWTVSANVTQSNSTTRIAGSYSQKFDIASGFTTGKIAYFDFGEGNELNLSAYQAISFAIAASAAKAGSTFRIDLCSDANGDTPVDQFMITDGISRGWGGLNVYSDWNRFYYNKGSALGSSIRSISIHALSDPGTVSIYLDMVIATNYLHHASLIGANNGKWFLVGYINGTTINLCQTLYEPTESGVAMYCIYDFMPCDIYATGYSTSLNVINDSGSAGNLIKYRGGWNFSSDQQDGYTNYNAWQCDGGQGLYNNGKDYIRLEHLRMAGAWRPIYMAGDTRYLELKNVEAYCQNHNALIWDSGQSAWIEKLEGDCRFVGAGGDVTLPAYEDRIWTGNIHVWGLNLIIDDNNNSSGTAPYVTITGTIYCWAGGSTYIPNFMVHAWARSVVSRSAGIAVSSPVNVIIESLEYKSNNPGSLGQSYISDLLGVSSVTIDNFVYPGTLTLQLSYPQYMAGFSEWACLAINGDASKYVGAGRRAVYGDHVTMGLAAGWGYGGTGKALVVSPTSQTQAYYKHILAPVVSGETYKFTAQVKKTSAGANCTLSASVSGCGITAIRNESVTLTDSWAKYESSAFTPTTSGYVRIVLTFLDGSSTGDIGLDDIKVEKQ